MSFYSEKGENKLNKLLFKALESKVWLFVVGLLSNVHKKAYVHANSQVGSVEKQFRNQNKPLFMGIVFCVLLIFVSVFIGRPSLSNAESTNQLRPISDSIDIFPSEIVSADWHNIETLNYQDLSEQSLFQEFNTHNSAFIDSEREPVRSESQQENPASESVEPSPENEEVINETDSVLPEVEQPAEPESIDEAATQNSTENVPESEIQESDPEPEESSNETEPVVYGENNDEGLSYFSVFKKAVGNFLFAQAEVTEPLGPSSDESDGSEDSEEISQEPETSEISEDQTDTTSTPDLVIEEVPNDSSLDSTETIQEVIDITEPTEDTQTSDSSVSEQRPDTKMQSGLYKLTLRDFGIPELASGQFIDNLQLRLSLAGQYDVDSTETPAFISVDYSFGEFERNAGSILIEEEASNAINGGYYLIPLPSITDLALLSDLEISISFSGDATQLESLFIDSVWLEAGTVKFSKDLLEDRFSSEEMLKHLDGPDYTELLSDRLDFLREELPQFNLRYTSQRNFLVRAFRYLVGSDLATIKEITFKNTDGESIGVSPTYTITEDGLVSIVMEDADKERLKPGVYTVEMQFDEGGYVTTDSLEFQWGLLSINSNQTEYSESDIAQISMGALSPNGNTLCDATLNLYIANPSGFITNPPVTTSGQCLGNNITDVPDFSASFVTDAPGTYEMYLERLDDAGNVISHTVDTFLVVPNQQIVIERNGPTRIYPPAMYPMELTVHALRSAFAGELIERVPSNFRVFNTDAEIREQAGYVELVWSLAVAAGMSQTVSYEFDAPDLSPYLYEVGPAQLVGEIQADASLQSIAEATSTPPQQSDESSEDTVDTEIENDNIPDTEEDATPTEEIVPVDESEDVESVDTDNSTTIESAADVTPSLPTEENSVTPPVILEIIESEPEVISVDAVDAILQLGDQTFEPAASPATPISFLKSVIGTYVLAQEEEDAEPVMESTTVISVGEVPEIEVEETTDDVVFLEHRQWQIASDATGNMVLYWDNGSTIPSGWTCLSCGSGSFYQNFVQGNATYNTTGGTATHAHTATGVVTQSALANIGNGGSNTARAVAHTHTISPTIDPASNLPQYRNLRVIQYTDGAGEPEVIPAGAIGIFDVASSSLPSGWTRYAAQDGYYIRGENTPGTTGGSNTHSHPVTGTTGNAAGGTTGGGNGTTGAAANHTHTLSTTTSVVNSEPPYITVLLAKITANGMPPNNLIAMWTDEVPEGWSDVSSAATSTFNGRFMKPAATYGTTGGATNHNHININNASSSAPSATVSDTGGTLGSSNIHTHKISVNSFSSPSNLPPYLTVIVGKRANFNPFYSQRSFRWYANTNAQVPTDVWPLGGTNIAQDESITATSSPVKNSEVVRLRMSTTVLNATSSAGSTFLLQYGENVSTCDAIGSWNTVGASTSTAIWRGYNNATPADHGTLSSTLLTGSTVRETYEENGYTAVTPNQIPANGVGEWDYVLQNNGATPGMQYCFRMVQGDTSPFFAYTNYPQLITDQVPNTPTLVNPFDNQKSTTTRPTFFFTATDSENDRLEYELTIDDNFDFSSPATTTYSFNYPSDTGWASSTFASGVQASYTLQPAQALTQGVTYWWRVRTRDPIGSNIWSATSTIQSVTIDTALEDNAWYQTLGFQFDDGLLSNISTSTGHAALLSTSKSVPTVSDGWTVATSTAASASLVLSRPSNVEAGDLLLIMVGNDNNTATVQWDNTTLKPAGFTLINEAGNTTPDTHVAAFYRVADGTEGATTTVPAQSSANYWGYYVRVTGASTTNPINVVGGDYAGNTLASHSVPSINTTQTNTRAFYLLGGDAGNTSPFSVSGTGWSETSETRTNTGTAGTAGTWGTRSMTGTGATGAATVAMGVSDGASAFQFAVNAGNAQGTLMSPEIDFDWVFGQSDWGDVIWNTTEPAGTDTKLRVYYTNTAACDTLVPNNVLAGNSEGFDVSQTGFWISALATTTYNRICVKATLDLGSGVTSPTLTDWTVGWVVPNQIPYTPILALSPAFEYQKSTTTEPTLGGFAARDYESNALEYEIIVSNNYDLSLPVFVKRSSDFPTDAGWSAATFSSGATTTYVVQASDALTIGETYWWAVRARDPLGTNIWSATSSVRSITISTGNPVPEWYQTTDAQFSLDGMANATATGDSIQIETLGAAATNITTQSAWSQQYAGTAYPNGTVNASYSVAGGTDRVLVVAIASTRTTVGTQSVSVYYGGKALTQATGDGTNATNVNHTYLFYLKEADINAATSTALNVQISGGTSYYTYAYASVFAGVDQTIVYTNARNYFSGATGNTTVGPFSPGLTVGQGDQAIEIINLARSPVGTSVRTVTTWANATWPNPSTVAATYVPANNWGLGLHINNRNATTSGTQTSQHTASGNAFDSMSAMSLRVAGLGSHGSATSTIIEHSFVPNRATWGEVTWDVAEPTGSDSLMRLYYAPTPTSNCDTQVPNGTLLGNAAGFDVSASPLNISGLATTTYNRLCLVINFEQGSAASSPVLNDWTVRWVRAAQFIQQDYRWYQNTDSYTPADPWVNAGEDVLENESIDIEGAVHKNDDLRLRMSLTGSSTDAGVGTASFKLQFAEGEICSADLAWYDVGDTASTTALWRGYNNASLADATALPSTLLDNSDVMETYEERNNSYSNPVAIAVGENAEWDWTLQNNNAVDGATYCFRMISADGKELKSYNNYPTLVTNSSPDAPTLIAPFDNEKFASTTPWFEFITNDPEGNELDYHIQIDDDPGFNTTAVDTDSESNLTDFLNIETPADKSPFNNFSAMRYSMSAPLSSGITYWWRVQAKDVNGSGGYGEWSIPHSFTIAAGTVISTWSQTTEAQFDTDLLEGTNATAGNLVAFASGSTTGTTTGTAINFADGTIGNAWGSFSFTETGAANNILYHLEYYVDGDWELIPDSALSGNTAGYDVSPVSLIDLNSSIYDVIRVRADFRSGSPTLLDWTVAWGERVSVPTHLNPFDNEKFATTTPTLTFYSTDPQNQDLQYEISWSTDYTFTTGSTTRNSSTSPAGFTNLTTGSDLVSPFISGDTIAYKVQSADALTASSTYWWRVRAKDPDGSNSFSFWSEPWSFTTATSGEPVVVSTWYQTLGLQFAKGTLTNVTASTESVGIGGGIVLESGWTSNTAVPNISLTLTKPTGVRPGDLLLIIVGNDNTSATAQWNNVALKPSGFTLINEAGNATPDAHVAAFYRVADGTEGASFIVPAQASAYYWGYCMRLTGVDTSSPIDVIGADYAGNTLFSHVVPGITTTANQGLAFYILGGDGGDTYPFSVSGTDWIEKAEIRAGTLGTNAAGTWGTRAMTTAGATGAATVTMTASDGAAGFQFSLKPTALTSGTIKSPAIDFDDGRGPAWGQLSWRDIELSGSQVRYQVEYLNSSNSWELIPEPDLSGNFIGFTTSPINLETLDTSLYNELRIVGNLNCFGATCPTVNDWSVEWSRGFSISGTAFEYDGTSSTTSGTLAVAVNGELQLGKTGNIAADGTWTIEDVTFFNGDTVTVFASDVSDVNEAVAITKYDGTPDITGMRLQKRHLTIGSNDGASISNADLAGYDFSNDEDLFYNVDGGNDLVLCADVSCADAGLVILSQNTYAPGTGADTRTHDFRNDGTFVSGNNTVRVQGSWDNNGTTTMTGSTVIFTATSTGETIDSTGAYTSTFNNVTLGETSGTATWTLQNELDIDGTLMLQYGTLARSTLPLSIAGNLTVSATAGITGIGTTTFDGINPSTWTDNSPSLQNIGRVVIDGTSKTTLFGSHVKAQSILIGTDDKLDVTTGNYDITVFSDWINNNTFDARGGEVIMTATTPNRTITAGGDAFYDLTFNGAGGSWSFTEALLAVGNDFRVSTGTVTLPPNGTTTVAGSWNSVGGTFAHNNGTLLMTSASPETIAASGTPFTNLFYNMTFSGGGSWSFLDTNATTSNAFRVVGGTVTFPNANLSIGGSFTQTGGTFNHNSGTVTFTSAAAQTIDVGVSSFNSLSFTGNGSWSFLDANITALGSLWVTGGTLTLPSGTLSLGGSYGNWATVVHNSGTVLFNSTDMSETVRLGNSSLNNMTFNSSTGGWTIIESATTTGNFTLLATASSTLMAGKTLAVGGVFTNSAESASTTWTGSILSLESGAYSLNTKTSSGDTYDTLRVKANTDIKMWNSSATSYLIDATGSLYSQDHGAQDGHLYIFGEYARTSGIEYWSYATDFDGTALGGLSRAANIRFANGASAQFTTATVQILGTSIATTTIHNQATGLYGLTLSNSTIDAQYYDIRHLNASGLSLQNGTLVDSLQNGRFTLDAIGGSTLLLSNSTIDANPGLQIYNVTFDTSFGTSSVVTTSSGNDTFIFFDDFNDANINTSKWTKDVQLGVITEANGYLRAGGGIGSGNYGHVSLGSEVGYDDFLNNAVVWRARNSADGIGELVFRGDYGTNRGYKARFDARAGANGNAILEPPYTGWNFSNGTGTCTSDSVIPTANQWYQYEVTANGTNFIMYRDGVSRRNCTDASFALAGEIALQNHYGSYTDYDWVGVRPFVTPEPSQGAWGAEEEVATGLYRESHVITGTTAGAQSGYVLPITVAYATGTDSGGTMYCNGLCNTDFSDVRFTNSDGSALAYWRDEGFTAGGTAVFWVKFDSIPASPQTISIYAYYGEVVGYNVTQNGGVPTSNWWFRESLGSIDGESYDNDSGNPGSVRWDDSSLVITLSGTVYSDDGVTPMGAPVCNGSTQNIRVVVNGGASYTGSCSAANGTYSISGVAVTGDPVITTYLNTNGGAKGTVITRTPTADITGLDIYQNRVSTRHEDVAPLTILNMALYDYDNDTDIPFTAATGTLSLFKDTELHIASSTTFVADGNITIAANASSTSFDGSLHIDDNATFVGVATSTYRLGGSFSMDVGATFTAATSTVILNATTTGKTITTPSTQEITFNALEFNGAGGAWNINGDIRAIENISVTQGTVSGTGDITVENGSLSGNGLLSMGSGTTTLQNTNSLGGITPWTFGNLLLGTGLTTGTTTPISNATTTILGKLTIGTAHFLNAGGSTWNLAGVGNVFAENGTFIEATSTVRYSGIGAANILSTTYHNLDLKAQGGSPTYRATGLGIVVGNIFTIGGATTTSVTFDINDSVLDVNGTLIIENTGTLIGSGSASTTISGSWDNNGTFTGSGGTVTFDGSGTTNIYAGNSAFSNLHINGTGDFIVAEHATTTGSFTLRNADTFTLGSNQSLAVGGVFTHAISGDSTTWTDSVLFLYGGGNYSINESVSTDDTYSTLRVGGGTQIRMWNSDALVYDVSSTGSLYSQDHADVDGDLYIYGAYTKSSGTDFWNYETDFDGVVLGSPRNANVYIAGGSSILYTDGGLSVVGATHASTTIQNQGSGAYSFRIGGSASTTWSYYKVRNTDTSGLVFSGTPTINALSYGDFEVSQNNGTAITIGGTAMQVKTFVNNYFGTSGASPAYNVTATGTTLNSWKFTNHSGGIAGEAYDVDPGANGGDPGYVVWDNSSTSISISGKVYSGEGSGISTACNGSTALRLVVGGATQYSTSCAAGTGAYTFTGVSFNIGDSFIVYIDGRSEKAATVSEDTFSTVSNFDLYENRVIVRHEGVDPLSIVDMAAWDSSDDGDIPFTAVDGSPDTLTLPANRKLIVWTDKEFKPEGNVTVTGGGAGAVYDGTLELYQNATFDATGSETHTIGGSLIAGTGAALDDETSTFIFTTSASGRTVDTNEYTLNNVTFNGSGSWTVTNTAFEIGNDFTITQGAVTLPSGTTTITGSLSVTGGSFIANGGLMFFNSSVAETIGAGSSSFNALTIQGAGSFAMQGTHATATADVRIDDGSFTSVSGIFAVGGDFVNNDTFTHNNGTLRLTSGTAAVLTASSSDFYGVTFAGSGPFTFTDEDVALRGTLAIQNGSVTLPSGIMSIAGSLLNTGGSFTHATGTILFNSSDTGELVTPGSSTFNTVSFASAGGGWTITGNATTTGNFSLVSASSFTMSSSSRLAVQGIFTNLVGGGATMWAGSTLTINSGVGYTVNTRTTGGDIYNNIEVGSSTALRLWDSAGTIKVLDANTSIYSQDHAGVSGALYIFGNYVRWSGADYWSYATDFDGTPLGGSSRQVHVYHASGATTTITGGSLNIVGSSSFDTMINNQGSGTYGMNIYGGTLNALYYSFANMGMDGLVLSGTTIINSLTEGNFTLAINNGSLITLSSTTLNHNAGLTVHGTSWGTTTAITGYNIKLIGTTLSAWSFAGHTGNLDGEFFDNDGADNCGSLWWDDSTCLLTQQSAYRWRNDDGGEGVPDSEWFNQDWTKRKRVTVTNNDATAYTNATVKLTVPHDGDMQADFDDLRFTSANGTTQISHYIETYTETQAVVWVRIPTFATSTDTEIFMYYGNGAVGDGSATSTFAVINNFENGISGYAGDTSLFATDGTFAYERSNGLDTTGNENSKATDGIYNTNVSVARGQTIRYMQYIDTSAGSGDETCTLFGVQSPGSNNQNYAVCLELYGVDRVSLVRDVDYNDASGVMLASTTITYATGWHEIEIDWRTNNAINVRVLRNGSVVAATSATDSTYSSGGIGFTFWFQHGGWDMYSSRTYIATTPSTTIGYEQTSGGATWLAAKNTTATGVDINETARIRFVVENTGLAVEDQNYEIEFAEKGNSPSCEAVSPLSYIEIPESAVCDESPICMISSSHVSNLDGTADILGGEGVFIPGQIVANTSNNTGNITLGAGEYTELEYAISATENVTDSNYCFRVSNEGDDLDSYSRVAELMLRFAPEVSTLTLNNGDDIILAPGATTTVYATGTVTDMNGYSDFIHATTTVYRSGVGPACTADNNNCYISSGPKCSFTNCVGKSCDIECSVDMYYHTDPTDIGDYSGEHWAAYIEVVDGAGLIGIGSSPADVIDVTTMRALTVDDGINYGALQVQSDTGSYNATTTIENIGNSSIDISIEGSDLVDGGASIIPVSQQRFATSTFTYNACTSCSSLAPVPTDYRLDLGKPASTTPTITDELFWGIAIPFGVAGTAHHGTNVFYARSDL